MKFLEVLLYSGIINIMPIFAYSYQKTMIQSLRKYSLVTFSTARDLEGIIPYMREEDKEVTSKSKFGVNAIGIVRSPYKIRYQTPKQGIHLIILYCRELQLYLCHL